MQVSIHSFFVFDFSISVLRFSEHTRTTCVRSCTCPAQHILSKEKVKEVVKATHAFKDLAMGVC